MNKYDAVIIGGGVMGTSIAYHLCENGYQVVLLDKGDTAGESSSHCDSVVGVASGLQSGVFGEISLNSVKYTAELGRKFSYDFEVREKGAVYLFENEIERELGAEFIAQKHKEGWMDYKLIDNYELHQLEPYAAKDLCGGYYCSGETAKTISPYKLCFAFIEEAKKTGRLQVYTYCNIYGIQQNPVTNAVEAVDTDQGIFYTGNVINCAGIGSNTIGKMVGLDIPVYPRKGTILVSEKTKELCFHKIFEYGYVASANPKRKYKREIHPRVEKYNVAFNMEYTVANNLLIGGNRAFCNDDKSELEVMNAIAARAIRFYPGLKDIQCIRSYAGFRPFTKDLKPIMSGVSTIPGFYICTGHEGSGILSCAEIGRMMADMIEGKALQYDLTEYSMDRFI